MCRPDVCMCYDRFWRANVTYGNFPIQQGLLMTDMPDLCTLFSMLGKKVALCCSQGPLVQQEAMPDSL